MNKMRPHLITTIIAALTASTVYFLLLSDNFLHSSISAIIVGARHLPIGQHLLILSLLPIYIAAVIFGAVWIAVSVNKHLRRRLKTHHCHSTDTFR